MNKILVVDDSKFIRKILLGIIKNNFDFNQIFEAENGIEAVKITRDQKPDIITLDLTMPVMDGFNALELIKEINHNIYVIIVSAMAGQSHFIIEAKEKGADAILTKPFMTKDVLNTINKY